MPSHRRTRDEAIGPNDHDEELQFGIRRSRRATSWEYRDSSSLTPAQIMDQEVYYDASEECLQMSIYLLNIIAHLSAGFGHFKTMCTQWQTMDAMMHAIAYAQEKMKLFKSAADKLLLLLSWIRAYGEMALLYAEDLTVFARRRNRFYPPSYRTIDELDRQTCYVWFGRTPNDLVRLYTHWRIPNRLRARHSRHIFQGQECFIVFLFRLIKGVPFTEMARHYFGGDPRSLSKMHEAMIHHLYENFYNKISGTSLEQWIPRYVHQCRWLIHNAVCEGALEVSHFINGEEVTQELILHHFDFNSFRPFGFLDDFALPTARPGNSAARREDFQHDIQRAFYSG